MILGLMLLGAGARGTANSPPSFRHTRDWARNDAASAKITFVFRGVDQKQKIGVLRPMLAPDLGVQLDSGQEMIARGEVLSCTPEMRTHAAIVEGQPATVSEQILRCGDRVFVVKGIIFERGKG